MCNWGQAPIARNNSAIVKNAAKGLFPFAAFFQFSLTLTGTWNLVLTGLWSTAAGTQLGIVLSILKASLSRSSLPDERSILKSDKLPLSLTRNETKVLPSTFASLAFSG